MTDYYQGLKEAAIVEAAEMNLIGLLGLVPYKDGNMWCILWGGNIQDGVCGFGKTPYEAVLAFNSAIHSNKGSAEK